jgi:hypothetical protein
MPEFATPFSGLANDRKLTKEELIRAIRYMNDRNNENQDSRKINLNSLFFQKIAQFIKKQRRKKAVHAK